MDGRVARIDRSARRALPTTAHLADAAHHDAYPANKTRARATGTTSTASTAIAERFGVSGATVADESDELFLDRPSRGVEPGGLRLGRLEAVTHGRHLRLGLGPPRLELPGQAPRRCELVPQLLHRGGVGDELGVVHDGEGRSHEGEGGVRVVGGRVGGGGRGGVQVVLWEWGSVMVLFLDKGLRRVDGLFEARHEAAHAVQQGGDALAAVVRHIGGQGGGQGGGG